MGSSTNSGKAHRPQRRVGRILQTATDKTGIRKKYAIPNKYFKRVVRAIVVDKDSRLTKISQKALDQLHQYVELTCATFLNRAGITMLSGNRSTLNMGAMLTTRNVMMVDMGEDLASLKF